ncbi:ABC transporter substrate-binding protein [Paenibacillus agaridevorans]|uniref:ABC transporter substrate-binding protein n=1 Tax=Paenibacillus agaridevorans TaxID=171404 RepID=A0A2R5EU10_9BACL|nr:extracellular solute-binding protein [Paenibacillus agaridevorans]GBG06874.1 ABC transporter substrate-binding protein [Paenibacillus agaridevorans]
MNTRLRGLSNKLFIVFVLICMVIVGCSNNSGGNAPKETVKETGKEVEKEKELEKEKEIPYVEIWGNNGNFKNALEKDSPYSKWMIDNVGVGYYSPLVPWEGGTAYIQRLNTRIASNDLPDAFVPWQGIEGTLIEQGALADLTDYLPKYAPHIWNAIPEDIWNVVRTSDPTGKGRIYYLPRVELYQSYGAFIRQDWLDRVGKKVPTTKAEFEDVLQAFLDQDANGNGDPNDEIPISGREFGRWMDVLFGMYGVAMWEGFPMWDIYEGEITYSGVTSNMRDAIVNLRDMYAKKLLDNETFLNSAADWSAKMNSDRMGAWFHINKNTTGPLDQLKEINPEAHLVALPVPKVDGYEGFVTHKRINRPEFVIANKGEETVINVLKILDWIHDPANREENIYGVEGVDHEVVNGEKVLLPPDFEGNSAKIVGNFVFDLDSLLVQLELESKGVDAETVKIIEQRNQIVKDNQAYSKSIAGDGLTASVYEGYADIQNHTSYQEVMTKIIIGDYPIEKFDSFVEEWYKSGGEEVTKRVREWYAQASK